MRVLQFPKAINLSTILTQIKRLLQGKEPRYNMKQTLKNVILFPLDLCYPQEYTIWSTEI